jgi:hypothetical protein
MLGKARDGEGVRAGRRWLLAALLAIVLFVALAVVASLMAYVTLLGIFLQHDARGGPVEPGWVGPVSIHAAIALVGSATGYGLGSFAGFRAKRAFGVGVGCAAALVITWATKEFLRGYPPEAASFFTGLAQASLGTAPFVALGAWAAKLQVY